MYSHIDSAGDPRIPFACYLAQQTQPSITLPGSGIFHRFRELPAEIQIKILESCDAATLFRLLQTCSSIRNEAEKLFYSHEVPWYIADSWWLIYGCGLPGTASHCPDFARRVHQVEVSCGRLEHEFHQIDGVDLGPEPEGARKLLLQRWRLSVEDQAQLIWETFKLNFPAAKRVVLSESHFRKVEDFFPREWATVVQACPPGIQIFISTRESPHNFHTVTRSLYQLVEREEISWRLVHRGWTRDRIQMPLKQFTGHVGAHQRYTWKAQSLTFEAWALREARIHTYENYHFGGAESITFACPYPTCNAMFTKKGEWIQHTIEEVNHDGGFDPLAGSNDHQYPAPSTLPAEVEAALLEKENSHRRRRATLLEEKRKLRESLGGHGTEKRRVVQDAVEAQLQNDPLYQQQCPPRMSDTWVVMFTDPFVGMELPLLSP